MSETMDLPVDGRLLSYLLKSPVNDGGQWDMIINILTKYGVVPKSVYPEAFHSCSSRPLNWLLTYRLREFAATLRCMSEDGKSIQDLQKSKKAMLEEIHRILCISLGTPPTKFDWNYYTKDKKQKSIRNLTPQSFFKEHVKCDASNYVSLIHDPRNEYYKIYTVDYLGNVVGGKPVIYINVPIQVLKQQTRARLEDGKAVWFGCDGAF